MHHFVTLKSLIILLSRQKQDLQSPSPKEDLKKPFFGAVKKLLKNEDKVKPLTKPTYCTTTSAFGRKKNPNDNNHG